MIRSRHKLLGCPGGDAVPVWKSLLPLLLYGAGALLEASPVSPGPTLLMHPVTASVERGGSGEVLLEAIPSYGGDIQFVIKRQPSHGSLGEIRRQSPSAVVLAYTNGGDKDASDDFTFRIKAPGKAWATCQAALTITDPPTSLQVSPAVLDFGTVGLGEAPSRKILLKNRLAGSIAGTLLIPSPWRVEGDGRYDLRLGESAEFTIVYEPHAATVSVATMNLLPSGNGPKLTLQGESVAPFTITPESIDIHPGSAPPEVTLRNSLDHPITVKAVTDDLVGEIPSFSLKPKGERKVRLKDVQQQIKTMNTRVRFVFGDYDAGVAVKILPAPPSTNQVLQASHDDKKPAFAEDRGSAPADAVRVTAVHLPTNTINPSPIQIGTGLPQVPTGPVLLPEEEQAQLRRLMVRDLSYFLKPGWFGWRLTLQWRYEEPPPKEFLIEEKILLSNVSDGGNDAGSVEYRRIKPRWIKSQGMGIWQASVPPPPEGFRFLRIAPVLEGNEKTIWASFQIQMPSNTMIREQYRGPLALLLLVLLVTLVLRMMGRL